MSLQKKTVEALGGLTFSTLTTKGWSLQIVEGPGQGQRFPLERELIRVGRADWCEIHLPHDSWVSSVHCELWLDESGIRVRDLNSRNGVQFNGITIYDGRLNKDVKLQVGQTIFHLHSNEEPRDVPIHYRDETGTLVGKSMAMRKIFSMLNRLGSSNVPTLIQGETGTGKTSIANALHLLGRDPTAPFVVVNCGGLPPSLIESVLFGYERGAFTGANKSHRGFFEQANGGTLLLDEIAELPLSIQPKLLDVLERKKIRRLGGEREVDVDFRLITATHRRLDKECEVGRFREDLFFRLSVVQMEVPSLRERIEDLTLLTGAILKDLMPDSDYYLTPQAQLQLESYLWPGNIRELRNVLHRTITFLEGDTIDASDLELPEQDNESEVLEHTFGEATGQSKGSDAQLVSSTMPLFPLASHDEPVSLKDVLQNTERILIEQALQETHLSVPDAAKLLSLSESWLYSRIKRYKLKTRRKRS